MNSGSDPTKQLIQYDEQLLDDDLEILQNDAPALLSDDYGYLEEKKEDEGSVHPMENLLNLPTVETRARGDTFGVNEQSLDSQENKTLEQFTQNQFGPGTRRKRELTQIKESMSSASEQSEPHIDPFQL